MVGSLGSAVRCRSTVLLLFPLLAIAAVVGSFFSARYGLSGRVSGPADSGKVLVRQERAVDGDDGPAQEHADAVAADESPERPALDLRRMEYRSWETKARAALRDGSQKDARKMFKLIQAFGSFLPRIQEITRMPTPSVDVFRKYIAPAGLPVVFTDMYKNHPLRQWNWSALKKKYGHLQYQDVRQGALQNDSSLYGKKMVNRVNVKLSDFIDLVTGQRKATGSKEEGLYIAKKQLLPKSVLQKEFPFPPFYSGAMENCFTEPSSWFGMAGTMTQGHIDARDNFAYQVIGQKRWHIFSPQDFKYLYFKKSTGGLEWSAALGQMPPNYSKYPMLKKAHELQVTLSEGEVLYLPRGWIHAVENVTPALMLNVWKKGPPDFLASWSEKYRNEISELCDRSV